ncbi:MAG TPA: hypothetical protein VGN72_06175 [Tepidisphaeraceae bacterium]|jgi:hypothetical protein|nr:hypothetical protein [Tepidisphaeraceae bacterium]
MPDPRYIRVPWYSQRWHLRYILPTALFAYFGAVALDGFHTAPVTAIVVASLFGAIAMLFLRISWQSRFPLRGKRRH